MGRKSLDSDPPWVHFGSATLLYRYIPVTSRDLFVLQYRNLFLVSKRWIIGLFVGNFTKLSGSFRLSYKAVWWINIAECFTFRIHGTRPWTATRSWSSVCAVPRHTTRTSVVWLRGAVWSPGRTWSAPSTTSHPLKVRIFLLCSDVYPHFRVGRTRIQELSNQCGIKKYCNTGFLKEL